MTFTGGTKLRAQDLNDHFGVTSTDAPLSNGTTTSTSFVTTLTGDPDTPVGCTFHPSPSGKVLIHWAAGLYNSGAFSTLCAIAVRQGGVIASGTVALAASDSIALQHFGAVGTTGEEQQGRAYLVEGLTYGTQYNCYLNYRVTGGTGNFARKMIIAQPVN